MVQYLHFRILQFPLTSWCFFLQIFDSKNAKNVPKLLSVIERCWEDNTVDTLDIHEPVDTHTYIYICGYIHRNTVHHIYIYIYIYILMMHHLACSTFEITLIPKWDCPQNSRILPRESTWWWFAHVKTMARGWFHGTRLSAIRTRMLLVKPCFGRLVAIDPRFLCWKICVGTLYFNH